LVNLLHHGIWAAGALLANTVSTLAAVLASTPRLAIVDALVGALWCWDLTGAVLVLGGSAVVRARGELVGVAARLVAIVATINDSEGAVVAVDGRRDTTVAAHVAKVVARGDIFCRQVRLLGAIGCDADAVGHGLHRAKGPARAAVGLVTDLLQAWALGCAWVCSQSNSAGKSTIFSGAL